MDTEIIESQKELFDYNALEVSARAALRKSAATIQRYQKIAVNAVLIIGKELSDVRPKLPSVEIFEKWCHAELGGMKLRTAYNFLRVHEEFGGQDVDKIAPSALYLLAAPSTPKEAREEALALAQAGVNVTHTEAKAIVEAAKEREEIAQGNFFAAEDEQPEEPSVAVEEVEPDCLCGHARDEHDEGVSDCKICKCEAYETERANRSNVETLAEVVETKTTTKTKTVAVEPPVVAPAEAAPVKGEGDLLFEQTTVTLTITLFPLKGAERDCMVWLRGADVSVNAMGKESQVRDALETFLLKQQVLAFKAQLVEAKHAKKPVVATPSKPKSDTKGQKPAAKTKKGAK